MELEKDTLAALIEHLKSHGYPEGGFAVDHKIGSYREDLAVIDPVLKTPVVLFELKSRWSGRTRGRHADIPLYLVSRIEKEPYFELERLFIDDHQTGDRRGKIPWPSEKAGYDVLNYAYQRNARRGELIARNRDNAKKTIDAFRNACWALAGLIAAAEVLHKLSVITLDAADITIFGLIIALTVIPFAGTLKILGIEFERLKKM